MDQTMSNRRAILLSRLPEMTYISEAWYSYLNTGGFVVAFFKQKDRKPFASKTFAFEDFKDGREEALFWAKSWRDDLYIELIDKGLFREQIWLQPTRNKVQPNNTTGSPGVQYVKYSYHTIDSDGNKHVYVEDAWAASWVEYRMDQKSRVTRHCPKKTFSVNKYGFDEAQRLAREYRKKMEGWLNSPEHIYIRDRRCKPAR